MPAPTAIVDFSPQVREAFDQACRAIFNIRPERASVGGVPSVLFLPGFATQYKRLQALPRRARRAHQRRWKCALSVIALLMTLGQGPAWAANIIVSPATPPSINSDGKCSLIEAIVNANRDARTHIDCVAGAGADTIILPEHSQHTLKPQEMLPNIWSKIVIEGHGATINRDSVKFEPRYVENLVVVTSAGDLTLNETTISGADPNAAPGTYTIPSSFTGIENAGGILTLQDSVVRDAVFGLSNAGTATLRDSTFSGNSGPYFGTGAGIHNSKTLVLRNCMVTRNGPGIINGFDSSLTLIDSTVSANHIPRADGGGINNQGTLLLVRSTVADNYVAYSGGGIYNSGNATLVRSTVSGNYSATKGGGFFNSGTLKLLNSTVSNNKASFNGGGVSQTQGFFGTQESELFLTSSTVTGNVTPGDSPYYQGGGLFVETGTVTLKRSIVSGNSAGAGSEISSQTADGSTGVVIGDDYNIIGHGGDAGAVGFTPGSTDFVPGKPLGGILLPLADNGGGTRTHALAIGSPALNASPDDATCPSFDQRGNPRPRGAACDIGAFEGAAVLCSGKVTTQVGTINADALTGTPEVDVISGQGGKDVIVGLDGNDVICAGGGADAVYGGIGNDVIFGAQGNDRLFGQRGEDKLNGGMDQDHCDGGSQSGAGDTATACESISDVP
jgi:hypothetical protein